MIGALGYFKNDGCLEMDDSAASQFYNTTLYVIYMAGCGINLLTDAQSRHDTNLYCLRTNLSIMSILMLDKNPIRASLGRMEG
jgi:hypothetical protein